MPFQIACVFKGPSGAGLNSASNVQVATLQETAVSLVYTSWHHGGHNMQYLFKNQLVQPCFHFGECGL